MTEKKGKRGRKKITDPEQKIVDVRIWIRARHRHKVEKVKKALELKYKY